MGYFSAAAEVTGFPSFEGGLKSETANGYLRAGIVAVGAACPLQSARFGMNVPLFPTRHLARLTFVALLLFAPLNEAQRRFCAMVYGVGMALTFDEFGVWLNLGGSYWQRASFDAVIVVLSGFGLLAFAPDGNGSAHVILRSGSCC